MVKKTKSKARKNHISAIMPSGEIPITVADTLEVGAQRWL